jgi:hypothetical protein
MVIASVWLCAGSAGPVSKLPEISADAVAAEKRKQQIAQIRDYYTKLNRVDSIAFHIRVANREYCKTVSPQIGIHAVTVQSLLNKYRSFSNERSTSVGPSRRSTR